MIDHLPECPLLEPCSADIPQHGFCSRQNIICIHCERECICDRLRACEQRVTDQVNLEWAEISVDDEVRIWNEALDAARDAVEEWLTYIEYEHLLREGRAAIDALREEKK